ncbi:MAG: hypothetical protein ACLQK8_31240 [Streptosporangiaceae bacterium]
MITDVPCIESTDAAVYVIPTDAPEADGTLAWNKTTMVLDPDGGMLTPDPARPGLGLQLREADARQYRKA